MPKSIFIVCQKVVTSLYVKRFRVSSLYAKKFKEISHKQCKIQITNLTFEPKTNTGPLMMPKSIFIVHECQSFQSYCTETMQNSNSNLIFTFGTQKAIEVLR